MSFNTMVADILFTLFLRDNINSHDYFDIKKYLQELKQIEMSLDNKIDEIIKLSKRLEEIISYEIEDGFGYIHAGSHNSSIMKSTIMMMSNKLNKIKQRLEKLK